MKFYSSLLFMILISILFVYCSDSDDEFGEHGPIVIEYGTFCGWCAGEEKITVSSVKTDYFRNIPCGENEETTNKTKKMSLEKWNEIILSFDYNQFLTLDYNECNVCADGCDEFIIITKRGESHEIRYSPSEEIEGIKELRQILNKRLEEFQNSN